MATGALGDLVPGERGIVLGTALAGALAVGVGDTVNLVTAEGLGGLDNLPRFRPYTVVGLMAVGLHDYDRGTALLHLDDAAELFQGSARAGLRLRLADPFAAPTVVQALAREALPPGYWVTDWTRTHGNYFAALQHQRRMLFFILVLIVAVAAFNLVATLVMVVHDKRGDIAILRTLGATPLSVVGVFVSQGVLIGLLGLLLGVLGGVLLTWNLDLLVALIETMLDAPLLAAEVYLLSELPTELRAGDVASVGAVAFALALLATLYPAWRAARTQPAAALRND
jgi:lipoprotein-releasing system permease protein